MRYAIVTNKRGHRWAIVGEAADGALIVARADERGNVIGGEVETNFMSVFSLMDAARDGRF